MLAPTIKMRFYVIVGATIGRPKDLNYSFSTSRSSPERRGFLLWLFRILLKFRKFVNHTTKPPLKGEEDHFAEMVEGLKQKNYCYPEFSEL